MKEFDLTTIQNSIEDLKEMETEVKTELSKKQSYYAKIIGESKQYVNYILNDRIKLKPDKLVRIYKLILDDLKGIERVGKRWVMIKH